MRHLFGAALLLLIATSCPTFAQDECETYLKNARDRIAKHKHDQAANFLRQAVTVCPSYESYQQLGETLSRLPDRKDQGQAVDAFISAYAIAPNDRYRAKSLYDYASLLKRDGDPQNAIVPARQAQVLAPDDSEIVALNEELEHLVQNPTVAQTTRAWSDSLAKPLPMIASGVVAAASPVSPAPAVRGGPTSRIPINFITGSTQVDADTARNVEVLAMSLGDPSAANQRFVLVGHADERGSEWDNLELSRRRAEAVYREVVRIEPSLEGRIDIEGAGEYVPIDPRHNEDAWRTNRRLEVVRK